MFAYSFAQVLYVILLAFLGKFLLNSPEPPCGLFEVRESCGTACPPTCENPKPQICTLQCVAGCFCIKGFYRNAQNRCVPSSLCRNFTSVITKK